MGVNAETVKYVLRADIMMPYAVRAAASVGILSALLRDDYTSNNLAEELGLNESATDRLLSLLRGVGIIVHGRRRGTWALSKVAREELMDGMDGGVRGLLLDGLGTRLDEAAAELPYTLRTGASAYIKHYGHDLWADLSANQKFESSFHAYLYRVSKALTPSLIKCFDWEAVDHLTDVGAGTGWAVRGLLEEFPRLRCTLLDRPSVMVLAKRFFNTDPSLIERVRFVDGDFFSDIPQLPGLYLLSQVLHDWPDESAIKILCQVRRACRPRSRVLLIERIVSDSAQHVSYMSFRMLMLFGSRERTLLDYETLSQRAGFSVVSASSLDHDFSCIELLPI